MSMICEEIQTLFPEYLTGDLDENRKKKIQNHTSTCATCNNELEELTGTWSQLGILTEVQPSQNLRIRFYDMLDSVQKKTESGVFKRINKLFKFNSMRNIGRNRKPVFQSIGAVLLLTIGIIIGNFFHFSLKDRSEINRLRQENHQFRQELVSAMLSLPFPSQRLKGLAWTSKIENPDTSILESLLNTLNNDTNVNVRLSAIDALYLFADNPIVIQGLKDSLPKQKSPLVQIALIDLLVDLRVKQASTSLKELLKNNSLNPKVKERAKVSLELL